MSGSTPVISKNLFSRLAVAAVGIPIILGIVWGGGIWLAGLVTLITGLAAYEFIGSQPAECPRESSTRKLAGLGAIGMATLGMAYGVYAGLGVALCVFILVSGAYAVIGGDPISRFPHLVLTLWGTLYTGLLYQFLYHIRMATYEGMAWTLFLLATLWIGDTAAMWVGKTVGKRKLAPTVSPNKTVAGAIACAIAAGLVGVVFAMSGWVTMSAMSAAVIAVIISTLGQVGDLVKSLWKRSIGVKDSSQIIPGHGGVIDRFDSLAFAAPTLYLILQVVQV